MKSVNPLIRNAALFGIFATFLIGSTLHFVYALTSHNILAGCFVPVNESVWEHLKLSFYAWFIFGIGIYTLICHHAQNYWLAIWLSSFVGNAFIVIFFYGYTCLIGHSIFMVDILSFLAACIISSYVFYKVTTYKHLKNATLFGIILLLLTMVLFAYCTFLPPHYPLFADPTLIS